MPGYQMEGAVICGTLWAAMGAAMCFTAYHDRRGLHRAFLWLSAGAVLAMLTLAAAASPLYFEYSDDNQQVVTFENGGVTIHPIGVFAWQGSGNVGYLPRKASYVESSVQSLTDNPKVRTIAYRLKVEIADPVKFFAVQERRTMPLASTVSTPTHIVGPESGGEWQTTRGQMKLLAARQLFSFNNEHSKELSALYNPFDTAQFQALKDLIEPYVNERVKADGLAVKLVSFTIS